MRPPTHPTEINLAIYQADSLCWLQMIALEALNQGVHLPDETLHGIRELCAITKDRLLKSVATPVPRVP